MSEQRRAAIFGRADEVSRLEAAFDRVVEDREPVVVLVSGEAGIGKSRLVAEAIEIAHRRNMPALVGMCRPWGGETNPAAAVQDLVVGLADTVDSGSTDFNVDDADRALLASLDPRTAQPVPAAIVDPVVALLRRVARRSCLVVVLEDLHWADATTLQLVGKLATARWLGPVLVLATLRSDEMHRRHALVPVVGEIVRTVRPIRIELDRLPPEHVADLCAAVLGETPDPSLVVEVESRSGGNPFLIEELLVTGQPAVTDTLRAALLARVSAFDDVAIDLLRMVAAAGSLPADSLADVCALDLDDLEAHVDAIVAAGLLVHRDGRLAFRHELAREVFEDLSPAGAAHRHAAIAAALDGRADVTWGELGRHWQAAHDQPRAFSAWVAAAREASRTGAAREAAQLLGRALSLWEQVPDAADRAAIDLAGLYVEASVSALHGGDLALAIELGEAALTALPPDDRRAAEVWLHLRTAYRYSYRWADCTRAVERSLELTATTPPSPHRVRALVAAALDATYAGTSGGADHAASALELAEELGDLESIVLARSIVSIWHHRDDALAYSRETVAMCDASVSTETQLRALNTVALEMVIAGRHREHGEIGRIGLDIVRRSGALGPFGPSMLGYAAWPLFLHGDWGSLERLLDEHAELCDEDVGRLRDVVRLRTGRLSDPAAIAKRIEAEIRAGVYAEHPAVGWPEVFELDAATGERRVDVTTVVDRVLPDAVARSTVGLTELVAAAIGELADRAERCNDDRARWSVDATRWIGMTRSALIQVPRSNPDDALFLDWAEAELTRLRSTPDPVAWAAVADAAERLELVWESAVANLRAAEAWLAGVEGRSVTAHTRAAGHARRAARAARQLGARPLLERVEALQRRAHLDPADAVPDRESTDEDDGDVDSFGLTPREREILVLVALGRTNGEIGAALFVSTKTASVHVSNILRKLGVSNRVEAASVAHRFRLLPEEPEETAG